MHSAGSRSPAQYSILPLKDQSSHLSSQHGRLLWGKEYVFTSLAVSSCPWVSRMTIRPQNKHSVLKLKGPSLTRLLFLFGAEGSVARFTDVRISRSLVYHLRQSLWTLIPSATTTLRPLLWLASLSLSAPFFKSLQMLLGLPSPKSFLHIGQVSCKVSALVSIVCVHL